ncbi:3'-5' exonuclease [Geminisphaera colitermitum]|uniref:3'-5' exonuclease n=1 Tax=Geminisphaera colitermitum TaxID=1148786 RepID=UPI000158D3DD|nr:3'-5' exonuclease [Geminisphaera colitermitum]
MNLVIFDLETTGFSPRWNDIIQIAAVRLVDGRISDETFSTYVSPRRPVPDHITELTGITDADVADAPETSDALRAFARFVGDVGPTTLVAHNGHRFDMRFIAESCTLHGLPMRPIRFIDSIWLSKKLWPAESLHNLDVIVERLGIETGITGHRRHDARADVHLLANAVRRMIQNLFPIPPAKWLKAETCEHDFVAAA